MTQVKWSSCLVNLAVNHLTFDSFEAIWTRSGNTLLEPSTIRPVQNPLIIIRCTKRPLPSFAWNPIVLMQMTGSSLITESSLQTVPIIVIGSQDSRNLLTFRVAHCPGQFQRRLHTIISSHISGGRRRRRKNRCRIITTQQQRTRTIIPKAVPSSRYLSPFSGDAICE